MKSLFEFSSYESDQTLTLHLLHIHRPFMGFWCIYPSLSTVIAILIYAPCRHTHRVVLCCTAEEIVPENINIVKQEGRLTHFSVTTFQQRFPLLTISTLTPYHFIP